MMASTIDKTNERLLSTRDGQSRFVAQFAASRLDDLEPARLWRLRRELTFLFAAIRLGPTVPGAKGRKWQMHPGLALMAQGSPISDSPILDSEKEIVTAAELEELHAWLQAGFRLLADNQKWPFTSKIEYELDFYKGILSYRVKEHTKKVDLLALTVFELLRDNRGRFRKCLRCGTPFFPVRRQSYCSARCTGTANTAAWRERLRAKAEEASVQKTKA